MFTRNLPIFIVFGGALVIGVAAMIYALANTDDADAPVTTEIDAPGSTLTQFAAEQAAKRAYYATDSTVEDAVCTAQDYDSESDVWTVECVLERVGAVVRTTWMVTPDGVATRSSDPGGV
jgi:hypothetical protein